MLYLPTPYHHALSPYAVSSCPIVLRMSGTHMRSIILPIALRRRHTNKGYRAVYAIGFAATLVRYSLSHTGSRYCTARSSIQ
eukprot:3941522-Rhodomonas_salina.1